MEDNYIYEISQPVLVGGAIELPLKVISRFSKQGINLYMVECIGHPLREDEVETGSINQYNLKWNATAAEKKDKDCLLASKNGMKHLIKL